MPRVSSSVFSSEFANFIQVLDFEQALKPMRVINKKESLVLLIGDLFVFSFALWISLFLRNGELPSSALFFDNLRAFSILFVIWIISFFIAGLYEKQRIAIRNKLPELLLRTEAFNSVLAIIFFYFIPYFGVTPKTILFIYVVVSLILASIWRIKAPYLFDVEKEEKAMLIANGDEASELSLEINNNPRYNFKIVYRIKIDNLEQMDFQKDIFEKIYSEDISIIIIDSQSKKVAPILPHLYNLIFSNKIQFIDLHRFYEEIFDKVPVSILEYGWFLQNISAVPHFAYDLFKRLMDIVVSFFVGIFSLVFYPFVAIAIKLDDGGPIFIVQERVGKNNRLIKNYKFRSMARNEIDLNKAEGNHITRVGKFLRSMRIDELPQLWSVFKGEISLIGPRPELPTGVALYEKEIPYYNIRHIIKPGLSGWAQIYGEHAHHSIGVSETKNKLSYDLYYIKNRSFTLDVIIALKTIKTILSRQGK